MFYLSSRTLFTMLFFHVSVRNAGVWQASADWGTWILLTECVNSGWTPGCTVSGTLWQPRPNDPARDCIVHREVFYSRTATPSSHYHPFSLLFFPHPLSASLAPCFTSLFCPPSSLNLFQAHSSSCVLFHTTSPAFPILSIFFYHVVVNKTETVCWHLGETAPCRPAKVDKISFNTQAL